MRGKERNSLTRARNRPESMKRAYAKSFIGVVGISSGTSTTLMACKVCDPFVCTLNIETHLTWLPWALWAYLIDPSAVPLTLKEHTFGKISIGVVGISSGSAKTLREV